MVNDKVTIADVARVAGVSNATVSRAFNSPELVTPKTRDAIASAAEALNFHINRAASGLRSGRHQCISILMADVSQPWYGGIARTIDSLCGAEGFAVKIRSFGHDRSRMLDYLKTVASDGVDGIILNTGDDLKDPQVTAALHQVVAARVGVVLIGQEAEESAPVDTVLYDDVHSADQATRHLFEIWGPDMCFIGDIPGSAGALDRRRGFDQAVVELEVESAATAVQVAGYGCAAGYSAVETMLDSGRLPGGILAVNDQIALGAYRALHDRGVRPGVDVGIVGFGDVEFARYLTPALSSVSGCVDGIAHSALDLLLAGMEANGAGHRPQRILIERPLLVRESSSGTLRSKS